MEIIENSIEPDKSLATVVKVLNVETIIGSDNIELATVLGWNVVVKKNEFKIGDLCIYFTIDSILDPNLEEAKFLQGKPLKTRKIRGVLSQGLLAPLSWLKTYLSESIVTLENIKEDDDVTIIMKVKKYIHEDEKLVYGINTKVKNRDGFILFPSDLVPKQMNLNYKE